MGTLWGIFCGLVVYQLYLWLSKRLNITAHAVTSFYTATGYRRSDLLPLLFVFPLIFIYILIRATLFAFTP
jgi:hypothetical protein